MAIATCEISRVAGEAGVRTSSVAANERDPAATVQPDSVAAESADYTPAEAAMLEQLRLVFDRLNRGGVPFCILRNRERIPHALTTGSDVDLIVPANTPVRRLVSLLGDLPLVHIVPHRSTLEIYLRAGDLVLHVDLLINDREWRGARYLENQAILAGASDDAGMPVASLPHQAFCAWFSSLTRWKIFKPRYIPLIQSAVRAHPQEMADLLEQAFGKSLGGELLDLAVRGVPEQAEALAGKCRRTIWRRALLRRPLATLRGLFRHYLPELKLLARPTGLCVAVLGPDGAGKSAVCSALTAASRAELPFRTVEVQHLYQRALPRLSELKKGRVRRRPLAPATVHDPHGKKPHRLPVAIFSLLYVAFDQWISRACYSRPKLGRNMLLLHDRHMLELVIDTRRFRFGGPRWLARCFSRIFPRPDLVILLDAPAEVLQSRKQEVPFEETRRQRDAYRALTERLPEGRIVHVDRPIDQVIADVKQTINNYLADRAARRFKLTVSK